MPMGNLDSPDSSFRMTRARYFRRNPNGLHPTSFFSNRSTVETRNKSRCLREPTPSLCSRGPETVVEDKTLIVKDRPVELFYRIKRWIEPSLDGWYSGDHHIHAAGCRHYENPTEGVMPEDMIRHIMGEDLKVGCCLTWGPCFDFQKRFFTGKTAEQSIYPYTLRYDVEVSGFGSHQSGHLNLLNLKEQIYPGGPIQGSLANIGAEHIALGPETGRGLRPCPFLPWFDKKCRKNSRHTGIKMGRLACRTSTFRHSMESGPMNSL